jgi:hypothetical protein
MLGHREREVLFHLERQLQLEEPELHRAFSVGLTHHDPPGHRRRGRLPTRLAGFALCCALLTGPRAWTKAEIRARGSRPDPRLATRTPGMTAPRFRAAPALSEPGTVEPRDDGRADSTLP